MPRPPVSAGICEDDHELRGVVRDALAREGYAVRATASGTEAVSSFTDDPPEQFTSKLRGVWEPLLDGTFAGWSEQARRLKVPLTVIEADSVLEPLLGEVIATVGGVVSGGG